MSDDKLPGVVLNYLRSWIHLKGKYKLVFIAYQSFYTLRFKKMGSGSKDELVRERITVIFV